MTGEDARLARLGRVVRAAGADRLLLGERQATLVRWLGSVDALEGWLLAQLAEECDVLREAERDPSALRPLLESLASPLSTPVRAAVYVLVTGGELREIQYAYARGERSHMRIVVATALGRTIESTSEEIWDVDFLRHLGLMKAGNRPIVDGYYSFASR